MKRIRLISSMIAGVGILSASALLAACSFPEPNQASDSPQQTAFKNIIKKGDLKWTFLTKGELTLKVDEQAFNKLIADPAIISTTDTSHETVQAILESMEREIPGSVELKELPSLLLVSRPAEITQDEKRQLEFTLRLKYREVDKESDDGDTELVVKLLCKKPPTAPPPTV